VSNVTILIGTYGSDEWEKQAWDQALPSTRAQGCEVLIAHEPDGSRHSVRNWLARKAKTTWLCFLDADDDLLAGYVDAMEKEMAYLKAGRHLLTPSVSYAAPGSDEHHPYLLPVKGIEKGNCLVLGTLVERDFFLELGGFRDWNAINGNEYDDWELWIRCLKAGADIVQVPEAVYVHRQTPGSPSRSAPRKTTLHWQWEIGREHYPEIYDDHWKDRILAREAR
jgi:hypothetical protein